MKIELQEKYIIIDASENRFEIYSDGPIYGFTRDYAYIDLIPAYIFELRDIIYPAIKDQYNEQ